MPVSRERRDLKPAGESYNLLRDLREGGRGNPGGDIEQTHGTKVRLLRQPILSQRGGKKKTERWPMKPWPAWGGYGGRKKGRWGSQCPLRRRSSLVAMRDPQGGAIERKSEDG